MRRVLEVQRSDSKVMSDDDPDGPPESPGEIGSSYAPSGALSSLESSLLTTMQRKVGDPFVDAVEARPLPALQKTITVGKSLVANRFAPFQNGLEGLSVSLHESASMVAVGCRDTKVLLLDATSMQTMDSIDLSSGGSAAIAAVKFRPDTPAYQNVLLLGQEDKLVHVHTSTRKVLRTNQEKGNKINVVDVRVDGMYSATAGGDYCLRIYDETTGQMILTLDHGDDQTTTGHSNFVYGLSWARDDPNVLVSGGWDRTVLVWDTRLQRSVRSLFGPNLCGDAVDIKEGKVLTGAWRHANPLQLWDLGSGQLLTNLPFWQPEPEACMLYSAKFGRGRLDRYIIAGGSGKRPCVKVYQQTGELVGTMPCTSPVHSIDSVTQPDSNSGFMAVCTLSQVSIIPL